MPYLAKQTKPWFRMTFMTSGKEPERDLFLQPQSLQGAMTK